MAVFAEVDVKERKLTEEATQGGAAAAVHALQVLGRNNLKNRLVICEQLVFLLWCGYSDVTLEGLFVGGRTVPEAY